MTTSYFAKNANNINAISIATKCPVFYKGREYKKLAPKYWFLRKYKKDGDEKFYIEQYKKEVLDKLDINIVYNELGKDAVLLCWEASGKFCHRHLVSAWFKEKLNIEVKEL